MPTTEHGDHPADTLSPAVPDDVEELTAEVLELAARRDVKLATAESCTGGLLASLLTDVVGKGHCFDRGLVSYSDQSKIDLLGVEPELLRRCGAVSREVAMAMALGMIERSAADIALSVTGFAGRGAYGEEPGLVHFALISRGGLVRPVEEHYGDIGRGNVRVAALRTALRMLKAALQEGRAARPT